MKSSEKKSRLREISEEFERLKSKLKFGGGMMPTFIISKRK